MRIPAILLLIVLAACSRSKMADYYVLTPQAFDSPGGEGPAIGLEPVILPKYVDRLNIVTTGDAPQRIEFTEGNVWAEPPGDAMTRILAENLAALLATDRVHVANWPAGSVDYRITVNVLRLTGKLGGEAEMHALWTVWQGDKTVVSSRTNVTRPAGDSYQTYVAALSDMLGELSQEIARAVPGTSSE